MDRPAEPLLLGGDPSEARSLAASAQTLVELERLLGLGASLLQDRREEDGTGWVVLADPEGNEFCLERSEAERAEPVQPTTS